MKRLKILISAYGCSPILGSEPGMAWQFIKAISKFHKLWIITEKEKFEEDIKEELEKKPELEERIKFYYIKKTRHRTLRKIWPPSYYWFYKKWQKNAYKLARSLNEEVNFDLVHQLNMVGFREPGYLWKLDLPFVWGPVGGMGLFPWRFLPCAGFPGAIYHVSRNIFNIFHTKFLIRPQKAAAHSRGALIAATSEMQEQMLHSWGEKSHYISEVGQTEKIADCFSVRDSDSSLRIAWSGQHTYSKALPLLLQALAKLNDKIRWNLDVLGQGTQTKTWKNLSQKLSIGSNCHWHGWIPKNRAIVLMNAAHVFIITSLKDLTSSVTLEALSNGIPIICLDHCGFADVVTPTCGIKISLSSPRQVTIDIARAIEKLWSDEAYRQKLAIGALKRAREFSWEKKMETLNDIYAKKLQKKLILSSQN